MATFNCANGRRYPNNALGWHLKLVSLAAHYGWKIALMAPCGPLKPLTHFYLRTLSRNGTAYPAFSVDCALLP
jgi:hypothetical protein